MTSNVFRLRSPSVDEGELQEIKMSVQRLVAGYQSGEIVGNVCLILGRDGGIQVVTRGKLRVNATLVDALRQAMRRRVVE